MKLVPQNSYVLCQMLTKSKQQVNEGIVYDKEQLATYKIIDARNIPDDFRLLVGDEVICNSTGTKVILDKSEYYLFNIENIIGKIS